MHIESTVPSAAEDHRTGPTDAHTTDATAPLVIVPLAATAQRRSTWSTVAPGVLGYRSIVRFSDNTEAVWIALRVTLAQVALSAIATPSMRLENTADDGWLALFDAGFFDHDNHPAGVLESEHHVFGQALPAGGSGIFFVEHQRAHLLEASAAPSIWAGKELAVQCGPRLVEPGSRVGIYADRGDRFARTALCLREHGAVVDVIITFVEANPLRGPGLFAFARALAAPSPMGDQTGCESALNLDGGPSTGLIVARHAELTHPSTGPVPFAIALRPRGSTPSR